MLRWWLFLAMIFLTSSAFAAHHFTEVYSTDDSWRVDHFSVEPGKLQDLVESKGFRYRFQAEEYAQKIKQLYPSQKNFNFVFTESAVAPLWKVENEWSDEWENKYAEWITKEFDADFFVRSGLATDCADVAYALRWIFARNNGLPAAGTLSGSGIIATHLSAKQEWNSLPGNPLWYKDQRFVAALKWLLNSVYTGTLYLDTYPVKLERAAVKAGLINLLGGHTEVFSKVSYAAGEIPMVVLSSTVPQAVRTLSERVFMDSQVTGSFEGGLVQFRWPLKEGAGWSMIPKNRMKYFSEEQYREDLCADESHFTLCMMKKLDVIFDSELVTKNLIKGLLDNITFRHQVVQDGIKFCSTQDCRPGTVGYEDWSTPSRDKRLKTSFASIKETVETIEQSTYFNEWLESAEISVPFKMKISDFFKSLDYGFASYDPLSSAEERWAKDKTTIKGFLLKKLAQSQGMREGLIVKAEACRQKPVECQKDRKNFDQLSTAELDFELRKLFSNWFLYSTVDQPDPNDPMVKTLQDLWKKSPAPWDGVNERRGEGSRAESHLIKAQKILKASEGKVILDQRQLYDVKSQKLVSLNDDIVRIYYDQATGLYLAHSYLFMFVLDQNLKILSSHPLSIQNGSLRVHLFGKGKALLYECFYEDCTGVESVRTFDLLSGKEGKEISGNKIHADPKNPANVLLSGQENISFALVGEKIETKKLASTDYFISQAMVTGTHEYVILSSGYDEQSVYFFGYLGKEYSEQLRIIGWMSLTRINSSFAHLSTSDERYLVDFTTKKLEQVNLELGLGTVDDQQLLVEFDSENIGFYLFSGPRKMKIPYTMKFSYSPLVSSGKNWFSLETGNVIDYQGRLISKSNEFLKGLCQESAYNRFCKSSDEKFLLEHYMKPFAANSFGFSRFGTSDGIKLTDVYGYDISLNTDQMAEGRVIGSLGESYEVKMETGTAIRVNHDFVLWYP